jgi:orotate phosphoribosyltransferase
MTNSVNNLRQEFIAFSVQTGVLRFGEFTTKAGRQSPYFFNAGLFHDGATLAQLAQFYAQTLLDSPSTARKPRTTAKAVPSSAPSCRARWSSSTT